MRSGSAKQEQLKWKNENRRNNFQKCQEENTEAQKDTDIPSEKTHQVSCFCVWQCVCVCVWQVDTQLKVV